MKIKSFLTSESTIIWVIVITLLFQSLNFAYGSISFGVLISLCFFRILSRGLIFKTHLLFPMLLYALMCLSLIWSDNLDSTLNTLVRLSPLFLIPFLVGSSLHFSKFSFNYVFKIYSYLFAVIALVYIIIGVINYLTTNDINHLFYHSLVNSAHLNAIYASSFAFVAFAWFVTNKKLNVYKIIGISIIFVFIVLLSSKTMIFLTLVLSVFMFIYKSSLKYKLILITGLMIIPVIYKFGSDKSIFNRLSIENETNIKEVLNCQNFTKVYPWTGLGLRIFQGRVAYEIIESNPEVFAYGVGLNASKKSITKKHKKYNLYPGFYEYNFHNQYIQTLIELGFVGLLFLVICLLIFLNLYLKNKSLFLLLIFILFLTIFITESYLMRQRGVIFFSLIYSILPINNRKTKSL